MDRLREILAQVGGDVVTTFAHNWPYLTAGIVLATVVQVYVGTERLTRLLSRRVWVAVLGAVLLGALTPFCSCGTTAVVLASIASAVPWAPIVAFMVSSPLTSPGEYVYSAGLFGWNFATTFLVAAAVIGLVGGGVAWACERRGWLAGQARMATPAPGRALSLTPVADSCCSTPPPSRTRLFWTTLGVNTRRIGLYFFAFAFLGYLVIRSIPTSALTDLLGDGSWFAVPLAATLGIPVYLSSDGSLPMVAALVTGGMSPGAALAFLVTGAGTSIGAISGMLVIARWRVVALVVGTLWISAIVLGYVAPLWLG